MPGTPAAPPPPRPTAPTRKRTGHRRVRRPPDYRAKLIAFAGTWRGEALLVAALFVLALAARWPYLQLLPHFTDEINEVMTALKISRGQAWPLTAQETYFGPIHLYIIGGLFKVLGPSLTLPRIVAMVFGALTVVATYLLGRAIAGRGVGFVAAALLITSPQHILINSHIAWQNVTMPLYSTLCLWGLIGTFNLLAAAPAAPADPQAGRALTRRFGGLLVVAGFLFGLALQTHPGVIVLAPALALAALAAFWWSGRWRVLLSPWPVLAVLVALVAYGPVIAYNVKNRMSGVVRVLYQRSYAFEMEPTWEHYRTNFANLGYQSLRMISDPTRLPARPRDYATSPYLLIALALCLAGLVLLARRRQPLPLLAVVGVHLIVPRYLKAYGLEDDYVMIFARYVAYLLPLVYIAMAASIVALVGIVLRLLRQVRFAPRFGRSVTIALSALLIALFVLYPLVPLRRYYAETIRVDPNNRSFFALLGEIEAQRTPRTPLLIDNYLDKLATKEGVTARDVIVYLLTFEGIPFREVTDPGKEIAALAPTLDPADTAALPLVVTLRDRCWPLRDRLPLQRVGGRLGLHKLYLEVPSYFALYRYTPAQPAAGCFGPDGPQAGD